MSIQANDLSIYDANAERWWDGSVTWLRTLKNLVPARLRYFERFVDDWSGLNILDVGCGGGFMSEAMAELGANVYGVDPSQRAIEAACVHAAERGHDIHYEVGHAESLKHSDQTFDIVVCVDVLEHINDVDKAVQEMARVLKPNGLFLFDTINRNGLAKLLVVTAAERMLGLLPQGAHDANMFIKPRELRAKFNRHGLRTLDVVGLGPIGVDRNLDITFGRLPTQLVQYMGVAEKTI